ncbi:MAG: hypothetical protein WBB76_08425 [Gaiellaceae bacterium]
MARWGLPVALVIAAAAADGARVHGLAFYALLAAVPAAAIAALDAFGHLLEGTAGRLPVALWSAVLGLTVVGAAVRAPMLSEGAVPTLGRTAVVACLALFCLQALVALAAEFRH